MKYKTKKIFKNVSLGLLGIGAIGAVGVGASKLVDYVKDDTKSLHLTYDVGGLGTDGKYVDDESTIYTKEKFACEGLKATLDFDNEINYKIFYYDILDNFISSTGVLTDGYSETTPLNGAYARIMITPTNDEDNKISFVEKYTYGNQLNLKVNKNAESNVKNKYLSYKGQLLTVVNDTVDLVFEYGTAWVYEDNMNFINDSSYFSSTSKCLLSLGNYKKLKFDSLIFGTSDITFMIEIFEFNNLPSNDSKITHTLINSFDTFTEINLQKDTKYLLFNIKTSDPNIDTYVSLYQNSIKLLN